MAIVGDHKSPPEYWRLAKTSAWSTAVRVLADDRDGRTHFLYSEPAPSGVEATVARDLTALLCKDPHSFEAGVTISDEPVGLGDAHELVAITLKVLDWTAAAAVALIGEHLLSHYQNRVRLRGEGLSVADADHIARWMVAARFAYEHAAGEPELSREERELLRRSVSVRGLSLTATRFRNDVVVLGGVKLGEPYRDAALGYAAMHSGRDNNPVILLRGGSYVLTERWRDGDHLVEGQLSLADPEVTALLPPTLSDFSEMLADQFTTRYLEPRARKESFVVISGFADELQPVGRRYQGPGHLFEYRRGDRVYSVEISSFGGPSGAAVGSIGWHLDAASGAEDLGARV